MSRVKLPIRLAKKGEAGTPFVDWLDLRLGGDRQARQRMEAFVQEWDLLRDEVGREPTVSEYAKRWNMAESTAFRFLEEFRRIFKIEYPGPVCALLWSGISSSTNARLVPLLGVKVIAARELP